MVFLFVFLWFCDLFCLFLERKGLNKKRPIILLEQCVFDHNSQKTNRTETSQCANKT